MAILEQLVYGKKSIDDGARAVLARSPGVSRDCVAEVTKLCEGWADQEEVDLPRPALLSVPLDTNLASMPGRLYTVIWVSPGPPLLFHAVILNEADYTIFSHNPFALAHEGIFVSKWAAGDPCERRDVAPMSLAPLVSPLPSEDDVTMIEEALHHFLVKGKVVLPLETSDEESDRFLALVVASLPLRAKRDLRFASWAGTSRNGYNLAAVHERENRFRDWHRLLMAEMAGPLNKSQDDYLEQVKSHLIGGDLLGLEQVSRRVPAEVVTPQGKVRPPKPSGVSATITPAVDPTGRTAEWAASLTPSPKRQSAVAQTASFSPATPAASVPAPRKATTRRRRRPRRSNRGGRITSIVALAVIAAGALYWMNLNGFALLPWNLGSEDKIELSTSLLGVIDVGEVYTSEMQGFAQALDDGNHGKQKKARSRALARLRLGAAEELREQAHTFIAVTDQGIQRSSDPEREAERLTSLGQRGEVIDQELRRLTLGYVSIESGVLWRDLARLDARAMKSRLDSLQRRDPGRLVTVADDLSITGLVEDLGEARLQVAGMSGLVKALAKPQFDQAWLRSTERSASLLRHRAPTRTVDAWCRSTLSLVNLKRAETEADMGALAFAGNYGSGQWLPAEIRQTATTLQATTNRFGRNVVPSMVNATADFYTALMSLPELLETADEGRLAALLSGLEDNRAVAFDRAGYGDHIDRARLAALASLRAAGRDLTDLPDEFFPEGRKEAASDFLALLATEPTGDDWEEISTVATLPFYARWAKACHRRETVAASRRRNEFDTVWAEIRTKLASINSLAAGNQDWTMPALRVKGQAGPLVRRFDADFAGDPVRRQRLAAAAEIDSLLSLPRTVRLSTVTVRLASRALSQPTETMIEITRAGTSTVLRSEAFLIGPAAPAGSGWVGNCDLDVDLTVGLGEAVQATVRAVEGNNVLLEVDYPAEGENLLPGGLTRLRAGEATGDDGAPGNITFRIAEDFWQSLVLPALPE